MRMENKINVNHIIHRIHIQFALNPQKSTKNPISKSMETCKIALHNLKSSLLFPWNDVFETVGLNQMKNGNICLLKLAQSKTRLELFKRAANKSKMCKQKVEKVIER